MYFAKFSKNCCEEVHSFVKYLEKLLQKTNEVYEETYVSFKEFSDQRLTVIFCGIILMLAISDFILRKRIFSNFF